MTICRAKNKLQDRTETCWLSGGGVSWSTNEIVVTRGLRFWAINVVEAFESLRWSYELNFGMSRPVEHFPNRVSRTWRPFFSQGPYAKAISRFRYYARPEVKQISARLCGLWWARPDVHHIDLTILVGRAASKLACFPFSTHHISGSPWVHDILKKSDFNY